jgi:hypothetical protein
VRNDGESAALLYFVLVLHELLSKFEN